MSIAVAVSRAATCRRASVGAVLVKDGCIVSTGYNGAPKGEPHCTDVGCEMEHDHCIRCVHAEANALIQAGTIGVSTEGVTLYTTTHPCRNCMGLIINAGIEDIVYLTPYSSKWQPPAGIGFLQLDKSELERKEKT